MANPIYENLQFLEKGEISPVITNKESIATLNYTRIKQAQYVHNLWIHWLGELMENRETATNILLEITIR